MGCVKKNSDTQVSDLVVQKKSKGNLFAEKPVFCDNGNSIVISSGPLLYLYSTSTGNLLKQLFQSSDAIISYQLHPVQDSLLIAISENGELTVINLKTSEIEYSLNLKLNQTFLNKQNTPKFDLEGQETGSEFNWETVPLDSLQHRKFFYAKVKAFRNNPLDLFVWTSWCLNDEFQCHLSAFILNSGKHVRLIKLQNSGLVKGYMNFVLGTVEDSEVFVGMAQNHVHIVRYDQKRPFSIKHYINYKKEITCLAFHPTECCFATGDSSGKIIIWKNIFERQPLKDVIHWHTLPVGDIYFSDFGNYLFSGGEENVLVKWSLQSRTKDFLPRLSSAIRHITAHGESSLLSVSTMDNKILIIDFNFQRISAIQHFSKWSILKHRGKLDVFTFDPRSNSVVLNGRTGHIQFLSLNDEGKFIYTFDVTNRNFVTSGDAYIENTEVNHAKFTADGKWLLTAESRWDGPLKESRLKAWFYSEKHATFALNTNIEFPHDEFAIHSLEVSSMDLAATTGGDNKCRLWALFDRQQPSDSKKFWAVLAVKKYRNLPCHGLDFSKDSSLVAVTFGPVLTVWETESSHLKCSLSVPYSKDQLKHCRFGNSELSHLVVTSTDFLISGWNIITLSMIWTVPLRISLLVSDPFSLFMAAFSADNTLIVFTPSSPAPDLLLRKVTDCPVIAAQCVPDETGKFCLYFLTSDQELYSLENGQKTSGSRFGGAGDRFTTPFSAQVAQVQSRESSDGRNGQGPVEDSRTSALSSLLDAPAHTLPNPSVICLEVLKGLVRTCESPSGGAPPTAKEWKASDVTPGKKMADGSTLGESSEETEKKLGEILKALFV